jgi:hypothetical protein
MNVQNYFLHELKDQGLLTIRHFPCDNSDSNIFMKNKTADMFNCHISNYVGHDEYVQVQEEALSREAV